MNGQQFTTEHKKIAAVEWGGNGRLWKAVEGGWGAMISQSRSDFFNPEMRPPTHEIVALIESSDVYEHGVPFSRMSSKKRLLSIKKRAERMEENVCGGTRILILCLKICHWDKISAISFSVSVREIMISLIGRAIKTRDKSEYKEKKDNERHLMSVF